MSIAFPRKVSLTEQSYDEPVSTPKGHLISTTVSAGGEPMIVRFYFIFGFIGIVLGAIYQFIYER